MYINIYNLLKIKVTSLLHINLLIIIGTYISILLFRNLNKLCYDLGIYIINIYFIKTTTFIYNFRIYKHF